MSTLEDRIKSSKNRDHQNRWFRIGIIAVLACGIFLLVQLADLEVEVFDEQGALGELNIRSERYVDMIRRGDERIARAKARVSNGSGVTGERSTRSQETAREDGSAGGKRSNDQSRIGNDATYKMEAVQIIREYAANEIRADNRYKGKVVEVRGVVKDISKDLLGGIFILVAQQTGADYLPRSVQCYFPASANKSIADLYVGQRVAVEGRVTGLLLHVQMKSCRLVSTK